MMNRPIKLAPLCFLFFFPFLIFQESNAQTPSPPPTDPSEVRALNSLFQQWDLQAPAGSWNISGEPCSGTAINGLIKLDDDNVNVNPALICNCTLDPVACHITQLRIHALNKRGVIPEELATLKYLQRIYIDKNSFTGTLPAFIGNLSGLITLSVGHNAFYGSIPKELGNLKELDMLALGTNNFSGTLPQELGYLPKLRLLYLDSSGIGGEIPSTFANLTNMVDLFTADSPFTGKIPDFIGNWTKLSRLRIQGNNFEGPIPSSFSNLTLLTSLRITDLHNVSSSLDFIKNMRNLTDLILRNALISDTLPLDIDKYQRLRTLDLSFNNITGPLPSRLMNMTALTSLFLGNNSLSGSLLPQMNDRLQNIDFSYNELSGTFPQWVYPSWPDLQLNLVGNNFRFDSSNISSFPGLHCLQRNFPCNRNPPPNADFSINCGGPAVRSSDGTLYEAENSTALGPAAYYVTQEKWAVSNVGVVIDRDNLNLTYIIPTNVQVANTTTPKLFRTSRTSPGSLRYYGLGLQNRTYNVSLFFAETRISERSTQTWGSHGRRVFDIYVQGIRREKDFDISKEAGGVNRAIQKSYQVTVTQNYLEIHLFWAGKGTCCIPEYGDYGPLISAVSVSSGSRSSAGGSKKSRTGLIVGISVAGGVVSLTLLILLLYFKRRGSKRYEEEEILGVGPKPNTYSYSELKTATDDFNPSNKLGEGGFGPVYKGKLNDGRIVAVKQLSVASHQGKSQFITEISTISAVQHWNLVKLYGFCAEGPKHLLVYKYLENRSLDQSLFGKNDLHTNWPTRFSICLGTARGLAYLHEESRPRIVHRDIKWISSTRVCNAWTFDIKG